MYETWLQVSLGPIWCYIGKWKGAHACMAFAIMPTIRPKVAPTAIDGTKIPAGTLHPYEMTTRPILMIVAKSKELTICHCELVLYIQKEKVSCSSTLNPFRVLSVAIKVTVIYSLAKPVNITAPFTLFEQDLQALCHVHSEKSIQITNNGGQNGKKDRFIDPVSCQVFSSESGDLEIEFDDKFTVETAENADQDIEWNFKVVPVSIVGDLEQDEFASPEWIHGLIVRGEIPSDQPKVKAEGSMESAEVLGERDSQTG